MSNRFVYRTKKTRRGRAAVVAVVAVMCVGVSACGSGGASSTATGGEVDKNATLRAGVDAVPTTFDPIENSGKQGNYTLPQLYDQLVQLDDAFQPEPMLATSWEFNSDGTELTMTLRDDVVFNTDQTPVTAEAVKVSIERAQTEATSLVAGSLANVSGVEAVDDTTVAFTFTQPAYSFVSDLAADPRISSVVDPGHLDDLARTPAGSGPYTLTSATQTEVVFTRVADHWDTTSGLAETIKLIAIAADNSRINAFKAGQIDLTYLTATQYDDAAQIVESGGGQVFYEPQMQKYTIGVNGTADSVMSNESIRKAVSLAVDRVQFCDTNFKDMSTPTRQFVSPINTAYDKALDGEGDVVAQVDEAKALVAVSGVENPTVKVAVFGTLVDQAEVLRQQLADVGITLEVGVLASLAAKNEAWLTGQYDAQFLSVNGAADASAVVSQSIESSNLSGGVPENVAAAVTTAKTTAPGDERNEAFSEINQILTESPLNIPLCDIGLGFLSSEEVQGAENVRYLGFGPPYETRRVGMTN